MYPGTLSLPEATNECQKTKPNTFWVSSHIPFYKGWQKPAVMLHSGPMQKALCAPWPCASSAQDFTVPWSLSLREVVILPLGHTLFCIFWGVFFLSILFLLIFFWAISSLKSLFSAFSFFPSLDYQCFENKFHKNGEKNFRFKPKLFCLACFIFILFLAQACMYIRVMLEMLETWFRDD